MPSAPSEVDVLVVGAGPAGRESRVRAPQPALQVLQVNVEAAEAVRGSKSRSDQPLYPSALLYLAQSWSWVVEYGSLTLVSHAAVMLSTWLSKLKIKTRVIDKRNTKVFTGQADGVQCR